MWGFPFAKTRLGNPLYETMSNWKHILSVLFYDISHLPEWPPSVLSLLFLVWLGAIWMLFFDCGCVLGLLSACCAWIVLKLLNKIWIQTLLEVVEKTEVGSRGGSNI